MQWHGSLFIAILTSPILALSHPHALLPLLRDESGIPCFGEAKCSDPAVEVVVAALQSTDRVPFFPLRDTLSRQVGQSTLCFGTWAFVRPFSLSLSVQPVQHLLPPITVPSFFCRLCHASLSTRKAPPCLRFGVHLARSNGLARRRGFFLLAHQPNVRRCSDRGARGGQVGAVYSIDHSAGVYAWAVGALAVGCRSHGRRNVPRPTPLTPVLGR